MKNIDIMKEIISTYLDLYVTQEDINPEELTYGECLKIINEFPMKKLSSTIDMEAIRSSMDMKELQAKLKCKILELELRLHAECKHKKEKKEDK